MRRLLKPGKTIFFIVSLELLVCIFSITVWGQTPDDISAFSPSQLRKIASRCETKGDYYTALKYMQECNRKKPDNAEYIYYLAELYRKSKQYESAILYYSNPVFDNSKKFPLRDFHLASLKMMLEDYEGAKKLFTEFRKTNNESKISKEYRTLAKNYISGCDSALIADTNQLSAYLYNLGEEVNSPQIEFAPFPLADDMILFGTLPIDSANVFSRSENNAPVRQLNIAQKKGKIWEDMGKVDWGMNHPQYSTGNAALSPDGKNVYFTRCFQNWKFKTICQIYRMSKSPEGWEEPEKLNELINLENYTSTQPTLAINPEDGNEILYFVSDRPGGKGGLDIWFSAYDKRKNVFKKPVNAGSKINTVGDDITPYFNSATKTLYFSSNGLSGFGGFDIYRIKGTGRQWEEPEHIGKPVNSSYNDLYPALNPDGNSGYFASNRPGSQLLDNNTCCDDIYFFNWKLPQTVPARGTVFQHRTEDIIETINNKFGSTVTPIPEGTLLDNVPVYLYLKKENGEKVLIQSARTINGEYNFNLERDKDYVISIKNYGFFDKSISTSTKNYLSEDTLMIQKTGISRIPEFDFTMYIYYEPGKSVLEPENLALLDSTVIFLLDLLPNAIIEIGSHTDNIGKEVFNIKLSQKRANEVKDYLKEKGVSENRLVSIGYGWSQPLAPNQLPDGSDNPEGRKLNRRTQIRIIGTLIPEEKTEE